MGNNRESRLGLRGYEDLGGGLKATLEVERRMNMESGTTSSSPDWDGIANVEFKGEWGMVRLGRVSNMAMQHYAQVDPFDHYAVGTRLAYGNYLYSEQLASTVRYDSPSFSGFAFAFLLPGCR